MYHILMIEIVIWKLHLSRKITLPFILKIVIRRYLLDLLERSQLHFLLDLDWMQIQLGL